MTLRTLQQWLARQLAPTLHHENLILQKECDNLHQLLQLSRSYALKDRASVRHLWRERADLTEIIASLVAKDDAGGWTTVFDADTRLPDTYQQQLSALVQQA